MSEERIIPAPARRGVLVGGSGLIGGALMHYFKTETDDDIEVLAPNSKKLSLREPDDIRRYFHKYRPDFIINAAIAAIDSNPLLAYEINYLGSIRLANVAIDLNIPYIHLSSSAIMPMAEELKEDDVLPLTASMSNYAKSKLMAEFTLRHWHRTRGLDYTNIRLAVVYGKHDHKIQGFHRLLFSIANQAMPIMLTREGVRHSYSYSKKIPSFVHYVLDNREEFSGQTYNFVDQDPVELADIILTIKSYLGLKTPREIYLPYQLTSIGKSCTKWILRKLSAVGIEARMPAELLFMENFYKSQTLSSEKIRNSSYRDPSANASVYSTLPELIEYYLTRWEHLNLINFNEEFFDPKKQAEEFLRTPDRLLETIHDGKTEVG